jgi:hypothetical protein
MWARFTGVLLNWNRLIANKINFSDNNGFDISLTTTEGELYVSGSGPIQIMEDVGVTWLAGGWNHIVVTFNDSLIDIYANDIHIGQYTIDPVTVNLNPVWIGTILGEIGLTSWIGDIDDVRIYNRVLVQSDIDYLWNGGNGVEQGDPIGILAVISSSGIERKFVFLDAVPTYITTTGFGNPIQIRNLGGDGSGTLFIGHDNTVGWNTGIRLAVYPNETCDLKLPSYGGEVWAYVGLPH